MYNLESLTILKDLKKTTKITRLLAEHYKEVRNESYLTKVTVTIINCLLTQNRKVFILNRDFLNTLIKKDTNHFIELGTCNPHYKHLVKHLSNFICKIEKVKRHKQYVLLCTVIHKDLCNLLTCNPEEQEKEVRTFISNNSKDSTIDVPNTVPKFRKIVPN